MRIFIAGPYTSPDPAVNVRAAIDAATRILDAGHTPFVPHLTHFWHVIVPRPYETWTAWDLEWLKVCDAVVRLPGRSPGADAEMSEAANLGLAMFWGLERLLKHLQRRAV
jgi:hypothetical protein